jgi:hypothetical protein
VELIKANEMTDKIRPICVEKSPVPKEITTVPTIVSENFQYFTGLHAFDFVKYLSDENGVSAYELGSASDTVYSFVDGNGEMERTMKYMYMEEENPFKDLSKNKASVASSSAQMDPRLEKLIEARKNDISIPPPIKRV